MALVAQKALAPIVPEHRMLGLRCGHRRGRNLYRLLVKSLLRIS